MRIAHHGKQFLDVNEADRVIEIFAAQRKARVPGFDGLFHIRFEIVLHVEVNNFAARRHDIAHDAVAQIEHIENKFAAERRDIGGFFALLENQSQFLLAVRKLARRESVEAEALCAKGNWKICSEARSQV